MLYLPDKLLGYKLNQLMIAANKFSWLKSYKKK